MIVKPILAENARLFFYKFLKIRYVVVKLIPHPFHARVRSPVKAAVLHIELGVFALFFT